MQKSEISTYIIDNNCVRTERFNFPLKQFFDTGLADSGLTSTSSMVIFRLEFHIWPLYMAIHDSTSAPITIIYFIAALAYSTWINSYCCLFIQ